MIKVGFLLQTDSQDFELHQAEVFLDDNLETAPNEMELGRFKLKSGSKLRFQYVDFHDLDTEFDTLNLVNIPFAAIECPSVSPYITRYFAREAYPHTVGMPFDNGFVCNCLNASQPIDRTLLTCYINARIGKNNDSYTNREIYSHLSQILDDIKKGIAVDGYNRKMKNRQIIVE